MGTSPPLKDENHELGDGGADQRPRGSPTFMQTSPTYDRDERSTVFAPRDTIHPELQSSLYAPPPVPLTARYQGGDSLAPIPSTVLATHHHFRAPCPNSAVSLGHHSVHQSLSVPRATRSAQSNSPSAPTMQTTPHPSNTPRWASCDDRSMFAHSKLGQGDLPPPPLPLQDHRCPTPLRDQSDQSEQPPAAPGWLLPASNARLSRSPLRHPGGPGGFS
eukprot:NODE_800_length_785_cov_608.615489_g538_i0.p1 GENE.NODE_800_length_785_cov_608.615489_g538_i0~~NODE_800_length_785_cov_608.615489_g538_i0.p1  ORF type:complete len:226 (+),score=72.47 NODE_800_length_785_cov_608.615489_g538_i0:27-680(+)